MIPRAISGITIDDLKALIGVARETKTLEFKRELPPGKQGAQKVLAGVSAMANAEGGDFIIGMAAEQGVAESACGIEIVDVDQYKLTLSQVLSTGIEPKLQGVDIKEIATENGKWLIVIRVQRSWAGPHRVNFDNNFYVRTSAATVPMAVEELRGAFGVRDRGVERVEVFRRDRLIRISSGEAPVRLQALPKAVLHFAPLPAFANRDFIDIVRLIAEGTHMPLPLRGPHSGGYVRANLLGLINFPGDDGAGASGYGQMFRSGAFEGVACSSEQGGIKYFSGVDLSNKIVGAVRRQISLQKSYGIGFPAFAMISFCNAKDLVLRISPEHMGITHTPPLGEDLVSLPEILIEGDPDSVPTALRPLLDVLWNAFGLPQCDMYGRQGEWLGTT